jgi:hypothetical protein
MFCVTLDSPFGAFRIRQVLKTMPYKIMLEKHGLLTKWLGRATTSELIRMQEEAHAHPTFDSFRYSIHDFGECEHFAYDQGEVEYSAAIDGAASKTNRNIKIAIVGANAEVADMVNGYINASFSPYPLRFFSSMGEAREWVMSA